MSRQDKKLKNIYTNNYKQLYHIKLSFPGSFLFLLVRSLFTSIITYRKESGNEGGSMFFKYYCVSYSNFLFNMKDGKHH